MAMAVFWDVHPTDIGEWMQQAIHGNIEGLKKYTARNGRVVEVIVK